MKLRLFSLFLAAIASCAAADLTGNWVVGAPLDDGTVRRTYLDLKQDGDRIAGHIRVTQFYYTVTESAPGPDGFTLTGTLHDDDTIRHATY